MSMDELACKLYKLEVYFQILTEKNFLYSNPYVDPQKYFNIIYIFKSLIFQLQDLLKSAEVNTSGEVTCPNQRVVTSLVHHLGHNGTLWANLPGDFPRPRGTACYKASQISVSRVLHNLQLDTFPCHLFSLQGSSGSICREHRDPVLGCLSAPPVSGLVGEWESSFWISAGSISGTQPGWS